MHINLTKEVEGDLTLREGLIISLDRMWGLPTRTLQETKDVATLKYRIIDSLFKDRHTFEVSIEELKYCVDAIKVSDYSSEIKSALFGSLDECAK